MIAVIFEVEIADGQKEGYLDIAGDLKPLLEEVDGFISVERFQSLTTPGKLLSLSYFEDEDSLAAWRNRPHHRSAQSAGRNTHFADYRLRIASVMRDYGLNERDEAPDDARAALEG